MANVTYLFGAGASANSIPIVTEFNNRIKEIIEYLKYVKAINGPNTAHSSIPIMVHETEYLQFVIDELEWVFIQVENHQTIDTLAKKFYHINKYNLKRLKRAIISYFILEQKFFKKPISLNNTVRNKELIDKRYDSFIASILQDTEAITLSNSVKILSWNYDVQFELTLKNYCSGKNIIDLQNEYQIFPNRKSLKSKDIGFYSKDHFALTKLNGHALFEDSVKVSETFCPYDNHAKDDGVRLNSFLEFYKGLFPGNQLTDIESLKYFNYSWEYSESFHEKYDGYYSNINVAFEIAKQTDILVIVGYSFPFFNRKIDNFLFENMNKLKKIIIQDFDAEEIKNRLLTEFTRITKQKSINEFSTINQSFIKPENIQTTKPGKYFPTPSELILG